MYFIICTPLILIVFEAQINPIEFVIVVFSSYFTRASLNCTVHE